MIGRKTRDLTISPRSIEMSIEISGNRTRCWNLSADLVLRCPGPTRKGRGIETEQPATSPTDRPTKSKGGVGAAAGARAARYILIANTNEQNAPIDQSRMRNKLGGRM
jgi:hypothetical protein